MNVSVTLKRYIRIKYGLKLAGVEDLSTVTKLTVTGLLTDSDVFEIRHYMGKTLQELDISKIDEEAFYECPAFRSVNIPASVVEIADDAFGVLTFDGFFDDIDVTKFPYNQAGYLNEEHWDATPVFITIHPDNPVYESVNGKIRKKTETKK